MDGVKYSKFFFYLVRRRNPLKQMSIFFGAGGRLGKKKKIFSLKNEVSVFGFESNPR